MALVHALKVRAVIRTTMRQIESTSLQILQVNSGAIVYTVPSLAAYETYRARLAADPLGQQNYDFAQKERFLLREDRTWLKLVSAPHGSPE